MDIFRRMVLNNVRRNWKYHTFGRCNICGRQTMFICTEIRDLRNNMHCLFCLSMSRTRHVAKMIMEEVFNCTARSLNKLPDSPAFKIYNVDAAGVLFETLGSRQSYFCSFFSPEVKPGAEIRERFSCQNLESLTFPDSTFDLVISEDVFEHVRHDQTGFKEVYRVLKTGGFHIFTIPFCFHKRTLMRVDVSTDKDVFLLAPEYHLGHGGTKVLAYNSFGIDLFDFLASLGFETKVYFSKFLDRKNGIYDSYVFVSKKL